MATKAEKDAAQQANENPQADAPVTVSGVTADDATSVQSLVEKNHSEFKQAWDHYTETGKILTGHRFNGREFSKVE